MFPIVLLFALAAQKADSSQVSDFPQEIIGDILTIFFNGSFGLGGNCTDPDQDTFQPIIYQIYARSGPPTNVTKPGDLPSPPLIYVLHGWLASPETDYIRDIKDAFLERYDAPIAVVDWSFYAGQIYVCAVRAVPVVARALAGFIRESWELHGIPLDEVHLVGHSLGGQAAGIAGDDFHKLTGRKIGRITGLDPAGPGYDGSEISRRLDPTDAEFVDVIHTSVGTAGYLGSLGHLDSYPNCGYSQPGCLDVSITLGNLSSILLLPFDNVDCSHVRSARYFAESVNSRGFVGRQCVGCGFPLCVPNLFSWERVVIGEDDRGPGEEQNYVLYTNPHPPFAQG